MSSVTQIEAPTSTLKFASVFDVVEPYRRRSLNDSSRENEAERFFDTKFREIIGLPTDNLLIRASVIIYDTEMFEPSEKDWLLRQWRERNNIPSYGYSRWDRDQNRLPEPEYRVLTPEEIKTKPIILRVDQPYSYNDDEKHRVGKASCRDRVVDVRFYDQKLPNDRTYSYDNGSTEHGCVVTIDTPEFGRVPIQMQVRVAERMFDLHLTDGLNVSVNGKLYPMVLKGGRVFHTLAREFDWSMESLASLKTTLDLHSPDNIDIAIKSLKANGAAPRNIKLNGIAKTYNNIWPIVEPLMATRPLAVCAFRSFAMQAGKSVNGVKISVIFNSKFGDIKTPAQFLSTILPYEKQGKVDDDTLMKESIFLEKRKQTLKGRTDRAFSKLMEDFDFLDMDAKKYPRLYKELTDGNIPLGIFFRKKETYFLLNDYFAMWEVMLRQHREVTCEIAQSVAKRSTYEKDLMSYFYFVLYDLPEYLRKQTGEKWSCIPRLVDSPNDLEMSDEEDEKRETDQGQKITKRRSALTPIADNEKKTVTVPFCSFRISGYTTQYCYSHTYHVLKRGFHFKGNTVMKDCEEKINGRDNYGLMFYTLTGSETARGYPTFLIIFEKRNGGKETFVHFHRTHPCRSKDGDMNPIHNLTRVCWNWMCGNVKADRIKAQQGDLMFCETDKAPEVFDEQVRYYDNHSFSEPVWFAPFTKKDKSSNVLGYVKIGDGVVLLHDEHEHVPIPAGTYELRQARSWEANPKGIWTLRID